MATYWFIFDKYSLQHKIYLNVNFIVFIILNSMRKMRIKKKKIWRFALDYIKEKNNVAGREVNDL